MHGQQNIKFTVNMFSSVNTDVSLFHEEHTWFQSPRLISNIKDLVVPECVKVS
jgi:hypothetical protein